MNARRWFQPKDRRSPRSGALAGVVLAVLCFSFWSCRSVADTTGTGALGVIDPETMDAIRRSSNAISRAAEEITPEQEYYLGRAVGANILSRYEIWRGDAELTNYLNEICSTIVINSPRPDIYNGYHVALLDSTEMNAFATPGGHIFITRGLVACADSEDALAAAIAHEIGHIQLQHSIKAIKNSRVINALMVTGTSAAKNLGNDTLKELADVMDESVSEIVTTLIEKGYSRDQIYNADKAAMALLAAAGYDPSSLVSMLRQLERNQRGGPGDVAKTHPSPTQRIENVRETALKFKVLDTRSYRMARYARIMQ
jgi:predicted Zn-dependent protease